MYTVKRCTYVPTHIQSYLRRTVLNYNRERATLQHEKAGSTETYTENRLNAERLSYVSPCSEITDGPSGEEYGG